MILRGGGMFRCGFCFVISGGKIYAVFFLREQREKSLQPVTLRLGANERLRHGGKPSRIGNAGRRQSFSYINLKHGVADVSINGDGIILFIQWAFPPVSFF